MVCLKKVCGISLSHSQEILPLEGYFGQQNKEMMGNFVIFEHPQPDHDPLNFLFINIGLWLCLNSMPNVTNKYFYINL